MRKKIYKAILLFTRMAESEAKKLLNNLKKYASSQDFKLNPDKKIVAGIIKGLIFNRKKYGEYYCPCRIKHTKKEICPCYYHKAEIKKDGRCYCGLFVEKK